MKNSFLLSFVMGITGTYAGLVLLAPLVLIMGSYIFSYEYHIQEHTAQLILYFNDERPVSNVLFSLDLYYPYIL